MTTTEKTTSKEVVLSCDIGGSSIKSGIYDASVATVTTPLAKVFPPIPIEGRRFKNVAAALELAIATALQDTPGISKLGISTTGAVDRHGVVRIAGHFEDYRSVDWATLLPAKFPMLTTIHVVNDGEASTWAEHRSLSSRVAPIISTMSSGQASACVVINNALQRGDFEATGHLGHTQVTEHETMSCNCGRSGCLEAIASAPGLVHAYNTHATKPIDGFSAYLHALRRGDGVALQTLDNACDALGFVTAIVANAINPARVTLGGGVVVGLRDTLTPTLGADYLLDRIGHRFRRAAYPQIADMTQLQYGVYNNDGGLIGAAYLASKA